MMAIVYASVGLAPLVYTYMAARESRSEYERRIEEAVREPIVPVHVVVVVRSDEEDVEARLVAAPVAPEDVAVEAAGERGEAIAVPLARLGPRLEGVEAPSSIGGVEGAVLEA